MCAPANYDALHTCILRIAELSTAGLATYALHLAIKRLGVLRREGRERPEAPLIPVAPCQGGPMVEKA